MYVVSRDELPAIHSVIVDDKEYNLGLLKDFRRHPLLKDALPEIGRFSASWVHLKQDEVLKEHRHYTLSMIIVTEGCGRTLGDLKTAIKTGDTVVVPAGKLHGFVGGEPTGFWGLSIQFEGTGLYENTDKPRVQFHS